MRTTKQLVTLFLVSSLLFYFSCKKTDTILLNENLITNSPIEEKFFTSNRTLDPTEKSLVDYLKRIDARDKFVEKTVAKIGYPRWDKAITNAKKKGGLNARNLQGDSIQTFYIPFVRDSQNFVNASMIIQTSQTDTSFTYRCDWQYAQMENNINSATDSAEHFATFFMVLDKAVFGYNKFNIVDTNLFRTQHGPTKYVKLDSSAGPNVNNFYDLVEFCQDVVVFVQYCQFPDSDQCRNGCDWCYQCVQSSHYTYCWEEYVWMGGGSTGGGTGGSGGGGGGGGSTPPDCGVVPVDPLVAGRVEPCDEEPGWEPEPIEDEPITTVSVHSITNTINPNFPCLRAAFDDVTAPRLINCIYNLYNETFVGTHKVHNLEILSGSPLLDGNNNPVPAKSRVKPNDNNTYQIALNEDMGQDFTIEYWSSVILHELVHGFIQKNSLDFTPSSQFQNIHQIMLTTWVGDIKEALLDIYPSMSEQDALCLAINGMSDMLTGDVNNTFKYELTQWMEQNYNVNSTMLGQVADAYSNGTKGTPCN